MITDPWFYAAAIPAVLIFGISKGGFGGGLGLVAVPLMTLAVGPRQAAAILLPILCVMDLFGAWAYRRRWDRENMAVLVPGALAGIAIGWATFRFMNADAIRIVIGAIALWFTLDFYVKKLRAGHRDIPPARPPRWKGAAWSTVSGFTSFVAHAGGPPLGVFLLPQRLDKSVFVGTTVIFFLIVNYAKLIPYAQLGQFDTANLATALVLSPLAPVGIWLGLWLHGRVPERTFYAVCYALLTATGAKLLWDGTAGLVG